jgi:hypothetical protein
VGHGRDVFLRDAHPRRALYSLCGGVRPRGDHLRAWLARLQTRGPLEFGLVGVLSSVAAPLAESGVGILAIATYDTDYVLVRGSQLDLAVAALRERGHEVR